MHVYGQRATTVYIILMHRIYGSETTYYTLLLAATVLLHLLPEQLLFRPLKSLDLGPQEMVILGLNVRHCKMGYPGNLTKVTKYCKSEVSSYCTNSYPQYCYASTYVPIIAWYWIGPDGVKRLYTGICHLDSTKYSITQYCIHYYMRYDT